MRSISASGSQTSLSGVGQEQRGKGEMSASSSTSLAYPPTESDSGSIKGNRSSFLKFMRGRSSSDTDEGGSSPLLRCLILIWTSGRGMSRAKPSSRKLVKVLGEDLQSLQSVPGPSAQPDAPWYLRDDYEPGEIIFDDRGGVKAGTLRALIARLTPHGSTGARTDTARYKTLMTIRYKFLSGFSIDVSELHHGCRAVRYPGRAVPYRSADWDEPCGGLGLEESEADADQAEVRGVRSYEKGS